MDETVDKKAKKARKPYVWTPQRKEAFERMRKKREEVLTTKKTAKAQGKQSIEEDKKTLSELLKNTSKIKQILALIDGKNPPEPPAPKQIETPKIKKQVKASPPPPVQEEEEESEEYSEEENEPSPPPKRQIKVPEPEPIKYPKQTFRYNTQVAKSNLPKPPTEVRSKPVEVLQEKKKSSFLYL